MPSFGIKKLLSKKDRQHAGEPNPSTKPKASKTRHMLKSMFQHGDNTEQASPNKSASLQSNKEPSTPTNDGYGFSMKWDRSYPSAAPKTFTSDAVTSDRSSILIGSSGCHADADVDTTNQNYSTNTVQTEAAILPKASVSSKDGVKSTPPSEEADDVSESLPKPVLIPDDGNQYHLPHTYEVSVTSGGNYYAANKKANKAIELMVNANKAQVQFEADRQATAQAQAHETILEKQREESDKRMQAIIEQHTRDTTTLRMRVQGELHAEHVKQVKDLKAEHARAIADMDTRLRAGISQSAHTGDTAKEVVVPTPEVEQVQTSGASQGSPDVDIASTSLVMRNATQQTSAITNAGEETTNSTTPPQTISEEPVEPVVRRHEYDALSAEVRDEIPEPTGEADQDVDEIYLDSISMEELAKLREEYRKTKKQNEILLQASKLGGTYDNRMKLSDALVQMSSMKAQRQDDLQWLTDFLWLPNINQQVRAAGEKAVAAETELSEKSKLLRSLHAKLMDCEDADGVSHPGLLSKVAGLEDRIVNDPQIGMNARKVELGLETRFFLAESVLHPDFDGIKSRLVDHYKAQKYEYTLEHEIISRICAAYNPALDAAKAKPTQREQLAAYEEVEARMNNEIEGMRETFRNILDDIEMTQAKLDLLDFYDDALKAIVERVVTYRTSEMKKTAKRQARDELEQITRLRQESELRARANRPLASSGSFGAPNGGQSPSFGRAASVFGSLAGDTAGANASPAASPFDFGAPGNSSAQKANGDTPSSSTFIFDFTGSAATDRADKQPGGNPFFNGAAQHRSSSKTTHEKAAEQSPSGAGGKPAAPSTTTEGIFGSKYATGKPSTPPPAKNPFSGVKKEDAGDSRADGPFAFNKQSANGETGKPKAGPFSFVASGSTPKLASRKPRKTSGSSHEPSSSGKASPGSNFNGGGDGDSAKGKSSTPATPASDRDDPQVKSRASSSKKVKATTAAADGASSGPAPKHSGPNKNISGVMPETQGTGNEDGGVGAIKAEKKRLRNRKRRQNKKDKKNAS